eukprot:1236325-Pleurochrysis_carterae.AAC.1
MALMSLHCITAGSRVGKNLVDLRGTLDSSCPHVLTNVVPRQMIADGDPNRRSCEQTEAIGVNLTFDLHQRCARRKKLHKAFKHRMVCRDGQ